MKKHMRTLAALVALSTLVSCYNPAFAPELTLGAAFAVRLGQPGISLGPIPTSLSLSASARFLPTRLPKPGSGFILDGEGSTTGAFFLAAPSTGGPLALMGLGPTVPAAGAADFISALVPLGPDAEFCFADGASGLSRLVLLPGAGLPAAQTMASLAPGEGLVAAGLMAIAGGSSDLLALLTRDGSAALGFVTMEWPPSTTSTALPASTPLQDPGGLSGGRFFAASPTGPFYWSGRGGRPTWAWADASSAPASLGLTDPMVGLLSDGTIVTQGRLRLSLWLPDGSLFRDLPAGDVRFAGENFGGSGQFVILTELVQTRTAEGEGELAAAIWQLPLAEFLAL